MVPMPYVNGKKISYRHKARIERTTRLLAGVPRNARRLEAQYNARKQRGLSRSSRHLQVAGADATRAGAAERRMAAVLRRVETRGWGQGGQVGARVMAWLRATAGASEPEPEPEGC